MIVNEDNTFDITENITVYFNISKHGIFRKIPLKNSVTRIDGSKSNNIAKITNISVSDNYTTSNENGYKVIKIGDSNQTLTGKHSYTINYKYNIGKDPLKNADLKIQELKNKIQEEKLKDINSPKIRILEISNRKSEIDFTKNSLGTVYDFNYNHWHYSILNYGYNLNNSIVLISSIQEKLNIMNFITE